MAKLDLKVPDLKLNDGTSIPVLGFGTGTAFATSKTDKGGSLDRKLIDQTLTATKVGYYHLDGAENYGTESELGAAIRESKIPRDQLFVTTKVSTNINDIQNAITTSLQKLGLDYVDLYLIHSPFFAEGDAARLQKAWADMEAVKASGKAKSIGVSNFGKDHLEAVLKTAKVPPSINQTEFHPYLQRNGLLEWQKERGIALAAYGPLVPVVKAKPGPVDDILATLSKKYAVSEGEILLRWGIDQGIVVVTTSSKEQRLSDMMRALAIRLTPKEVDDISKAGQEKHFRAFWGNKFAEGDRT